MKNLGHVSVALLRRPPRVGAEAGGFAVSWPGSAHPARNRPHSFRQNFLECNRIARFFQENIPRLALPKRNNACEACEQFETNTATLVAAPACDSSASRTYDSQRSGRIQFFSGSSLAKAAAVLSWKHTSPSIAHVAEPTPSAAGAWSNR
jgi:hypothetical protein